MATEIEQLKKNLVNMEVNKKKGYCKLLIALYFLSTL